jgi:prevent-host-death family protein
MRLITVNSRKARSNMRDLLDRVFSGDADVIIERHGKPVAVMIPVEDYAEIQDELDDLRAAHRAAEIYESWKEDASSARDMDEIERELIEQGLLDDQSTNKLDSKNTS